MVWSAGCVAGALPGARLPQAWAPEFAASITVLALIAPRLRSAPHMAAACPAAGLAADRADFGRAVVEAVDATGATAHKPNQNSVRVVRCVEAALHRQRRRIERTESMTRRLP